MQHPLVVMLLCFPGICCWTLFLSLWLRHVPRVTLKFWILPALVCWGSAILTAVASLVIYSRKRKRWWTWLNLVINVLGLAFTAWVAVTIVRGH